MYSNNASPSPMMGGMWNGGFPMGGAPVMGGMPVQHYSQVHSTPQLLPPGYGFPQITPSQTGGTPQIVPGQGGRAYGQGIHVGSVVTAGGGSSKAVRRWSTGGGTPAKAPASSAVQTPAMSTPQRATNYAQSRVIQRSTAQQPSGRTVQVSSRPSGLNAGGGGTTPNNQDSTQEAAGLQQKLSAAEHKLQLTEKKHAEEIRHLSSLLEQERAKKAQAKPADAGTAETKPAAAASTTPAVPVPADTSTVTGGVVHVSVLDVVEKFVEEADVKAQLSATIVERLPAAAAAGDLGLVQSSLCGTSTEAFASYIGSATNRMAAALGARAVELLNKQKATKSAHELNGKFAMEAGMIEGAFGTMDDFLKGVEGIGLPQPDPLKGMYLEFYQGPDAEDKFQTSNYNTITTPHQEWDFVVNPFDSQSVLDNPDGPRANWKLRHDYTGDRDPIRLRVFLYAVQAKGRNGKVYADFEAARYLAKNDPMYLTEEEVELVKMVVLRFVKAQIDERSLKVVKPDADDGTVKEFRKLLTEALIVEEILKEFHLRDLISAVSSIVSNQQIVQLVDHFRQRLGKAGLGELEVIGLRLYTGPPFLKVNSVLRNWSGRFPAFMTEHLKGNKYINTISVNVSALTKLAKVSVIPMGRKSYRGMAGVRLPRVFWEVDELRASGGVEYGFMSTTTDKEVAIAYIPDGKDMPIIFEIELGCIDRGSSLSFLSQYPHEDEITFPPLSYIETTGQPYVEVTGKGDVIVMPARINCNLKGRTVEELFARRKEEHISMRDYLGKEMFRDLQTLHAALGEHKLLEDPTMAALFVEQKAGLEKKFLEDLEEYKHNKDPSWFNRDDNYKRCMNSAIDFKAGAIAQLLATLKLPLHTLASGKGGKGQADPPEQGVPIMRSLLMLGADTEAKDPSDGLKTLLHTACDKGNAPMAKLLLEYSADIEAVDQDYKSTPLLFACDNGHAEVVEVLLANQPPPDMNVIDDSEEGCLYKAASKDNVKVVEAILRHVGPDVFKEMLKVKDNGEQTPLINAACYGHKEIVKLMIDNGAEIEDCDKDGKSALIHAAESEKPELVSMLIECKADVSRRDKEGNTALHRASYYASDDKTIKVLLGVTPEGVKNVNKKGRTALHCAAEANMDACLYLLEQGADPKAKDTKGQTAAQVAKESEEKEIMKMLKTAEAGGDWKKFKGGKEGPDDDDDDLDLDLGSDLDLDLDLDSDE